MTAGEILENELNEAGMSINDNLKCRDVTFASVKKVKKAILKVMKEYAKQELINYGVWCMHGKTETKELVDEYLKQR